MQASHLADDPVAGPEMEVIGIAQLDLAADFLQVVGGDAALDGRLGAYIHEHRGLDYAAMGTGELAAAGAALGFQYLKHRSSL